MQGLLDATPDPHKLPIMDIGEVTVLIVDDEALARAAMRRALRPLSPLRILQA